MKRGAFALFALSLIACDFLDPNVGAENAACDGACTDGGATDGGVSDGGVSDGAGASDAPTDGVTLISFARDVRPIFDRVSSDPRGPGCSNCHYRSAADPIGIQRGGLDLTTLGSLRMGGLTSKTTIINVAHPEDSALVQKLRGTYFTGKRMPYDGPPYLKDSEIQLVADWMAQGAVGADNE